MTLLMIVVKWFLTLSLGVVKMFLNLFPNVKIFLTLSLRVLQMCQTLSLGVQKHQFSENIDTYNMSGKSEKTTADNAQEETIFKGLW